MSRHNRRGRPRMDLWFETALLPGGWATGVRIGVADGRIVSVERDASPGDARHAIGLPGLCNVHSHGFQRGMAGLSERRGRADAHFWSWREVMYPFLDRLPPHEPPATPTPPSLPPPATPS